MKKTAREIFYKHADGENISISNLETVVFKAMEEYAAQFKQPKKPELPKRWEQLRGIRGAYVRADSYIVNKSKSPDVLPTYKNIFATREQAEASVFSAMYSQLIQVYKDYPEKFIEIAKEYEPKVRPMLELFFGEYAESAFYLGLLGRLREVYRQGWKPDWNNLAQRKQVIYFYGNDIEIDEVGRQNYFLSFQSSEIREQFLENFRDLIEKIESLMS